MSRPPIAQPEVGDASENGARSERPALFEATDRALGLRAGSFERRGAPENGDAFAGAGREYGAGERGPREHAAAPVDARVLRWFVPGRIEVLGKHTDYAGGRSLLCAVERGFCVTAIPREDDRLRIVDVLASSGADLRVSPAQCILPHWRNYPATVARRVARNFGEGGPPLHGADVAIASDLPRSSGLSSSSALIIAIFSVLAEVNTLREHPAYRANIADDDALASYLGCIENGRSFGTLTGDQGVGTRGGSQDHLAILGSAPGQLMACRFSPVRREQFLPVPHGYTFIVGSSGVTASKTGRALERYNRASAQVATMLAVWNREMRRDDGTLFDALVSEPEAASRLRALLRRTGHEALLGRLEQFQLETFELIPRAIEALVADDLTAFGAAVDRSQRAATHLLGNQVPETIALAALARELGAAAASAFGAGFGGSVWALVRKAEAEAFIAAWRDRYLARFPAQTERVQIFETAAGRGRWRLDTRAGERA